MWVPWLVPGHGGSRTEKGGWGYVCCPSCTLGLTSSHMDTLSFTLQVTPGGDLTSAWLWGSADHTCSELPMSPKSTALPHTL